VVVSSWSGVRSSTATPPWRTRPWS